MATGDRCRVVASSTGVGGSVTFSAAFDVGDRTFAAAVTAGDLTAGDIVEYTLETLDRSVWEVRYGTLGAGGTSITYDGLRASSSGSTIDWTSLGTLTAFADITSDRIDVIKPLANGNFGLSINAGTLTASDPFTFVQTLNSGGTTFNAFSIDLTSTASAADSLAFRTQLGGVQQFAVGKAGVVAIGPGNTSPAGLLHVYDATASTGVTRQVIRAGAGQSTTNLQEWQNSSGTVITKIGPAGSLTVATGTITASTPGWNLTQTWNSGSETFYGAVLDITKTAAAGASRVLDIRASGTTRFAVSDQGIVFADSGSLVNGVSQPHTFAQTWANGSENFIALKVNVTNTASGSGARLLDLQVGGVSVFGFKRTGTFAADTGTIASSDPCSFKQTWNNGAESFFNLVVNSVVTAAGSGSRIFAVQSNGTTLFGINRTGAINADMGSLSVNSDPYSFAQTWANGTTTFTAFLMNVTNSSSASGSKIFDWQLGGSSLLALRKDGQIQVAQTVTGGGTTGNQTINKAAGTVNFAAAASSLTVTNSLVTTSSTIYCAVRTNDTTAIIKNVVPGSGSFVITLNAAATAETSVGFLVIN